MGVTLSSTVTLFFGKCSNVQPFQAKRVPMTLPGISGNCVNWILCMFCLRLQIKAIPHVIVQDVCKSDSSSRSLHGGKGQRSRLRRFEAVRQVRRSSIRIIVSENDAIYMRLYVLIFRYRTLVEELLAVIYLAVYVPGQLMNVSLCNLDISHN